MPALTTYALTAALALLALMLLWEVFTRRNYLSVALQFLALLGAVLVLRVTTGFPEVRQSFGGVSQLLAIGIMFVCVLLGIGARYVFYLEGAFSWRNFFKPLVIAPIVLLPLIGSVQASLELQSLQVISLAFLSFQNGFFWVSVLERAQRSKDNGGQP